MLTGSPRIVSLPHHAQSQGNQQVLTFLLEKYLHGKSRCGKHMHCLPHRENK